MRFEEALKAMRDGKKVREKCWNDWEFMWIDSIKIKWFANPDLDEEFAEEINSDMILAEDWEIIDD